MSAGRTRGLKPPYLGNTHGAVHKVRNRQGARSAWCNLEHLRVNDDQAIVLDAVTVSFGCVSWTAVQVVRADLVLRGIEVDACGFPTAAAPLGA